MPFACIGSDVIVGTDRTKKVCKSDLVKLLNVDDCGNMILLF